jgi:hypothetical protein
MLTTIADLEKEIDLFHKNVTASNKLVSLIDSMRGTLKELSFVLGKRADALQQLIGALPNDIKSGNEDLIKQMLDSFSAEQKKFEQALESAQKKYAEKLAETEKVVISIPEELKKDNESALAGQVELLKKVQDSYAVTLRESQAGFASQSEAFKKVAQQMLDSFSAEQKKFEQALESAQKNYAEKLAETEKVVISIPEELKKDNESALAGQVELLKKVQDSYAVTLRESQAGFASQSEAFIKVAQELSVTLEEKHHAFLEKLESTNMGQIYKYCQDMNKSLNTKLVILIVGVAVATALSIVSFFI